MNPIAAATEQVLRDHPHPALTLGELVGLLRHVDRGLDEAKLRGILERYPDRFRILDPWGGAWRALLAEGEDGRSRDVWVIMVEGPATPPADTPSTALVLRESVRWLARGMDPRSPGDVGRWYAIALSEREARGAFLRRAA